MAIEITLTSGRTIAQGEAMEVGKELDAYTTSAAVCELDPKDMEALGAADGDTVKVSTEAGEVYVRVTKSTQEPHRGLAFIPLGPWANAVIGFDTSSTGMPSFKGVKAVIELSKEQKVLSAKELVRERYAKYKKGAIFQ